MRWLETSEGYSLQQDPPLIWVNRLAVYLSGADDGCSTEQVGAIR